MSIENKIDQIQADVAEIKTHMAVYNEQLRTHIKRTDTAEKRLAVLEKYAAMAIGAIAFLSLITALIEAFHK